MANNSFSIRYDQIYLYQILHSNISKIGLQFLVFALTLHGDHLYLYVFHFSGGFKYHFYMLTYPPVFNQKQDRIKDFRQLSKTGMNPSIAALIRPFLGLTSI